MRLPTASLELGKGLVRERILPSAPNRRIILISQFSANPQVTASFVGSQLPAVTCSNADSFYSGSGPAPKAKIEI